MSAGRVQSGWRLATAILACLVAVGSVAALVAWAVGDVDALRLAPGYSPQVPITAVSQFVLAICVLLLFSGSRAARVIAPAASVVVVAAAAALFAEYLFDRSFALESVLFSEQVTREFTSFPGRPSIWTALALMLTGIAVSMLRSESRAAGMVSGIALVLAAVVIELVVVAYVYRATEIVSVFGTKPMSLLTVTGLTLLVLATMAARPDRPPLGVFSGGARLLVVGWMLPFAFLVPILEWLIEEVGVELGLDRVASGVIGRVVVAILVGALVVGLAVARSRQREALASERRMALERERYRVAFREASTGLVISDVNGAIEEANAAFANLVGRSQQDLVGRSYLSSSHPAEADIERRSLRRVIQDRSDGYRMDKRFVRPDGTAVWADLSVSAVRDPSGEPVLLVGVVTDLGERKRQERALIDAAAHDALTGLVNRRVLDTWLAEWTPPPEPQQSVLVFADLDDFKSVNDALGHEVGDDLLREVARRLTAAVRGEDLVVRLGGDEFVVAATVTHESEIAPLLDRIHTSLDGTVVLADQDVPLRVSLGHAVVEDDAHDALALADERMYAHKREGRPSDAADR